MCEKKRVRIHTVTLLFLPTEYSFSVREILIIQYESQKDDLHVFIQSFVPDRRACKGICIQSKRNG